MDVPDRIEFDELRNHVLHYSKWNAACAAALMFLVRWQHRGRELLRNPDGVKELLRQAKAVSWDLGQVGTWSGSGNMPNKEPEHIGLETQALAFEELLAPIVAEVEHAARVLADEGAGAEDPTP